MAGGESKNSGNTSALPRIRKQTDRTSIFKSAPRVPVFRPGKTWACETRVGCSGVRACFFSGNLQRNPPSPAPPPPPRPCGGAGVRSPRLRSDYQNMCRGLSSFSVTTIFYVVCHRQRGKGLWSRRQIFSLEWFLSSCVGKLDSEIFTENMISISSLSGNSENVSQIMQNL